MDPDNPVVKLCVQGMAAESAGQFDQARRLFAQAWEASRDDYEACIAAHYLARHAETPEDILHWNRVALERANLVGDERVAGFLPSLYLNLGWAHENLGDRAAAAASYTTAASHLANLPAGPYRDTVAEGIRNGQRRLSL